VDWLKKIFLAHVRRLPGKKLLLCDNLSSHISVEVVELCREANVEFVCLPPNSTDKLQPLDVGVFGPMKRAWRQQLQKYSDRDPAAKLLMKSAFPGMLKELFSSLNTKEYLPRAFEKCGLYPINRTKVLERIPNSIQVVQVAQHVDKELIRRLEVRRFGESQKKKPRGKKIPAGQSHTREDSEVDDVSEMDESEMDEMSETDEVSVVDEASEVDETSEVDEGSEVDEAREVDEEGGKMGGDQQDDSDTEHQELPDPEAPLFKPGSHVVAVYEGQLFLCEVCKDQKDVPRGYTKLSYMVIKGSNSFAWGSKADLHMTLNEDILISDVVPEPVNSRGHLGLKKTDHKKALSRMVTVFFPSCFINFSRFLSKLLNSLLSPPSFLPPYSEKKKTITIFLGQKRLEITGHL
jgi:hypothetical protein